MIVGLAMQSVMGPLNLFDNAIVKAFLFGKGGKLKPEDKIFQEKFVDELTEEDEIIDKAGNPKKIVPKKQKSFEEIILDVWDSGAGNADISPLMDAINKENCNYKVKEKDWTPLMILSGIGVKGTGSAIRQVIALGADPSSTDGEGWNVLHWAAFHGNLEAAKVLIDDHRSLCNSRDKEGKTPLEHAKAEGNDEIAKLLQELESNIGESSNDEGLRKRK